MAARPLSVEKLLIHQRWLHRLAVHIVHDDELAHDLVQETWLAALGAAPPSDEKVRPWLAGVLRNLARMNARTAVRRRGRERAWVDEDEALPSTAELLERTEAQELLVNEVQRLDEPYRSTILLLYFEGLPAADIADRLDVPDSTIRWRHRHALESLRKVLAVKDPQRRRLRTLLIPVGGAAAMAVESGAGFFGGKSLWAGVGLVLASVLALWPDEAQVHSRSVASFPLHAMSIAAPAAAAPAPMMPVAHVLAPDVGVELLVRVTDLDDVPIAAAGGRIGGLDVGSTRQDGRLVVAEELRPRIPRSGTIAVQAAGYWPAAARYRLAQPLHLRLVPLAGAATVATEVDAPLDSDRDRKVDAVEAPRTRPFVAPAPARMPSPLRCSTAAQLTLNLLQKELSMNRMSPQVYAMALAMIGSLHQAGCLSDGPDGGGALSGERVPADQIDADDEEESGGACTPADPCGGAAGTGSLVGVRCLDEAPFDLDADLTCSAARDRCQREARDNPEQSIYCEWNGIEILRHEASAGSCSSFGPALEDVCESEPEPQPDPDPEPDPDQNPTCDHPCAGDSGTGTYRGFFCGGDDPFIVTRDIDCQAALGNCALNAALNPDQDIVCEWNGDEIFRREVETGACTEGHGPPVPGCDVPPPDACDGNHPCVSEETGSYRGSRCGGGDFILTDDIDCQAALGNCVLNTALNPDVSFRCEWNGDEIYRREVQSGACDAFGEVCAEPPH